MDVCWESRIQERILEQEPACATGAAEKQPQTGFQSPKIQWTAKTAHPALPHTKIQQTLFNFSSEWTSVI